MPCGSSGLVGGLVEGFVGGFVDGSSGLVGGFMGSSSESIDCPDFVSSPNASNISSDGVSSSISK